MSGVIVAMGGMDPQVKREADGLGLVALVETVSPLGWDGNAATTLLGRLGDRIKDVSGMKTRDYLRWFDKVNLIGEWRTRVDPQYARKIALELLPALAARPRLVLLGRDAAEAFGVWEDNCFYRWRWATWSAIHQGVQLDDDRSQLIVVVPHPDDDPQRSTDDHIFWRGLAQACKAKRARTN